MAVEPQARSATGKTRGVALISIMLVLAVLATLVIFATEAQNLAIRRAENLAVSEQGFQVNLSGEQWVVKVLEKDIQDDLLKVANATDQGGAFDHPGEVWGNLGGAVEVGETGTTLLMAIVDQQGFLNVNNLAQGKERDRRDDAGDTSGDDAAQQPDPQTAGEESDPDEPEPVMWFQIFQNLFVQLELNPELVDAVIDWVDANQDPVGTTGAEDFYYSGLETPYRVPDRSMSSVSELAMIRDFDDRTVSLLMPWLSALPVAGQDSLTPVNVNTAPATVLALFALDQPQDPANLEPLISARAGRPFESLEQFREQFEGLVPGGLVPGADSLLDVSSRFFAGRSCAAAGRVKFSMSSLLEKQTPANNVKVLQRERFFGCPDFPAAVDESGLAANAN